MKLFGIDQISNAYFSGNEIAYKLRKNLVKNPEVTTLKEALHLKNQFFSDENIKFINQSIVKRIYEEMNVKIPLQNGKQIKLSASYVWEYYGRYLNHDQKNQINRLNEILIDRTVPKLKTVILQRLDYLKDIDYSNKRVNALPVNATKKNELPSMVEKLSFKKFKFNY